MSLYGLGSLGTDAPQVDEVLVAQMLHSTGWFLERMVSHYGDGRLTLTEYDVEMVRAHAIMAAQRAAPKDDDRP
jgi:hypothetical protein